MKNFLKYLFASILGVIIAFLILFFISLGILSAIISSQDKTFKVQPQSVLMLKLDQPISDRKPAYPFYGLNPVSMGIGSQIGLNELLANIKKASKDTNICGIYLELSIIQTGIATIEEIRNALLDFKKSGKFIISYADFYEQSTYYLASVADKVYMNPLGVLNFDGLNAEILFYKKALDKLDIEPEIIRHGKFKSAVEPLINDKMSEENRLQIKTYIGSIWQHIISQVSLQRGIPAEKINAMADNLIAGNAYDVYQMGLIDSVLYKDQVLEILTNLSKVKNTNKLNFVTHNQYTKAPKHKEAKGYSKNKIAVIYASGNIIEGDKDENNISSEIISRTIRKAREDSSIKAIVFRVNSGGGSALASEIIWREIDLARKVKPVIASMGDVAASGGYYIVTPADTIISSPVTLTGSIGVFGVFLNAKGFFNNKLGISADVEKTNRHADFGSLFRPLDNEEKQNLQRLIDNTYETFITHVAEGRNMQKDAVDKIGEGRVWSGSDAKNIGLVDNFGGLEKAIDIAAEKAGIKEYRIVELPRLKNPIEQLISDLSGEAKLQKIKQELPYQFRYYYHLKNIIDSRGIMARLPFDIEIY
jgi:protease-4